MQSNARIEKSSELRNVLAMKYGDSHQFLKENPTSAATPGGILVQVTANNKLNSGNKSVGNHYSKMIP